MRYLDFIISNKFINSASVTKLKDFLSNKNEINPYFLHDKH